jgi:hypothetical protein
VDELGFLRFLLAKDSDIAAVCWWMLGNWEAPKQNQNLQKLMIYEFGRLGLQKKHALVVLMGCCDRRTMVEYEFWFVIETYLAGFDFT